MSVAETVYKDRDNAIDLILKADDVAVDLSSVTRMQIVDRDGGFTTIDSDTSADAFDWDTGTTGKVILILGDEEIPVGTYVVSLVVFDPTNTDGIVWGEFVLVVK